ncbi:hypothetical protein BU23DRAFT_594212 [Bimuria novae-zelandiae CBS 107.79]|uniref:NAD-dependent epimerase/dehydratase domain-containing protein n=1 Tax=Bimuria novae-zelandiae CBS 107.79 TaxID=1447943 RepID=A0A6A5UT48_9PLEO|nr:hypothetical protein BU23DRAFT_594212 [Bimuria novae-zelandiae CBS 107.79]
MPGTVILTGANGSSGLHAAAHLLHTYPDFTALLTVRSAASTDANTNTLRATISRFPASKASIHEVDLADLSAVHNFTTFVSSSIAQGELPPLQSNPLQRVLLGPLTFVAHAAMMLRLLEHFDAKHGARVIVVFSVGHFCKPNPMTVYVPGIPGDLDELVHPWVDEKVRYQYAKLAATVWCYALNARLQAASAFPRFSHITAVAINPGDSADSRVFQTNTLAWIRIVVAYILVPIRPLYRLLVDPTWRPSSEAGVDIVELAVNHDK